MMHVDLNQSTIGVLNCVVGMISQPLHAISLLGKVIFRQLGF
jgi:hypothetical protein